MLSDDAKIIGHQKRPRNGVHASKLSRRLLKSKSVKQAGKEYEYLHPSQMLSDTSPRTDSERVEFRHGVFVDIAVSIEESIRVEAVGFLPNVVISGQAVVIDEYRCVFWHKKAVESSVGIRRVIDGSHGANRRVS